MDQREGDGSVVADVSLAVWFDGRRPLVSNGTTQFDDLPASATAGEGCRIVMLDSGIEWSLPVFRGATIQARDFTGSGCLSDSTGHGTANASVLVGQGGGTVVGLAPLCELLVGKVLGRRDRARTERAVVSGLRWAVAQRADIVVLPFGSQRGSRRIANAIERAVDAGCCVFAAAGNQRGAGVAFPARLARVQAVSVLRDDGRPDPDYCMSGDVDVFAPGRDVPAERPDGPTLLSGSSIAAVLVAGLAALRQSSVVMSTPDPGRKRHDGLG